MVIIIVQSYCSNDSLEINSQMQISNSIFSGLVPEMFTHSISLYVPLTSVCCIHSNVYGLGDIYCIWYLTAVDPTHSTSPAVQKYHHLTSGPIDFPPATGTGKSSFIGEEPVPCSRVTSIRRSATSSVVSHAEQGTIIPFTNVLQSHKTVVLVCCTIE